MRTSNIATRLHLSVLAFVFSIDDLTSNRVLYSFGSLRAEISNRVKGRVDDF